MGFWPVPSKRSRDLAVCGLRPDVRPAPGDVSLWVGRRRARRWRRSCRPVLTPGPPPPVAGARRRRPEPGPGRGPGRARLPGPPVRLTAHRRDGGGPPPRLIAMCRPRPTGLDERRGVGLDACEAAVVERHDEVRVRRRRKVTGGRAIHPILLSSDCGVIFTDGAALRRDGTVRTNYRRITLCFVRRRLVASFVAAGVRQKFSAPVGDQ